MNGVIDGGFPFLHERLRHETTGKTLIERLWVQQIDELSIAANFGVSNGVTLTQKNIALWSCLSKSHRTHPDHCLGLISCKPSVS